MSKTIIRDGQAIVLKPSDPGYPVDEPPLTFAALQAARLTDLATVRYQHEVGGITVLGIPVPTDRETQSIVDRICKAFDDGDIDGTVSFKSPAGFVALDANAMKAIKALGAQHVQACFARESALAAEIVAAADQSALDAIDINAGWPA